MDLGYAGRVAVVTGGTSGIELATAQLLLREGARVAICGRDEGRLDAARVKLAAIAGADALLAVGCDVLDGAAVTAFAEAVGAWCGGRLDLLVNNAGQGRVSTFASTTEAYWRAELELNLFRQILPVLAFRPILDRSDSVAIIAVNSLLAVHRSRTWSAPPPRAPACRA